MATRSNLSGPVVALVLTLVLPSVAAAQAPSLRDIQVADIETMKEKFVGLAGECSEAQYDWRPMEGVRSVRDVLALIVAECHQFPAAWGHEAPSNAAAGFGPEMQRASALSKADMVREIGLAFDHLIGSVASLDEAERHADSQYFGRPMQVEANVLIAMADMHEHLGQLIAYARTNQVVPPWSQ
jgi:hypothetical protein